MSDPIIIQHLLTADCVLIPFEELGGLRQVSVIVAITGEIYTAFALVDDERVSPGAVRLTRSSLDSRQLRASVEGSTPARAQIRPKSIRIVETSTMLDGRLVSAIEELTLSDGDGCELTLTQEGAYYAYNLTLRGPMVVA